VKDSSLTVPAGNKV